MDTYIQVTGNQNIFYPLPFSRLNLYPQTINPKQLQLPLPRQNTLKRKVSELEKEKSVPNPYLLYDPSKRIKSKPAPFQEPNEVLEKELHSKIHRHSFTIEKDNPNNPVATFVIEEQSESHFFEINLSTLQKFPGSSLTSLYVENRDAEIPLLNTKVRHLKTIIAHMLSGSLREIEHYDVNETFLLISACKKLCCDQIIAEIDATSLYKGGKPSLCENNIFTVLNWVFYFATNENEYCLLNNIFKECILYLNLHGIKIVSNGQDPQGLKSYFEQGMTVIFENSKAGKFLSKKRKITPFPFSAKIININSSKNVRLLHIHKVREKIAALFPNCTEIQTDLYEKLIRYKPLAISGRLSKLFGKLEKLTIRIDCVFYTNLLHLNGEPDLYDVLKQSDFLECANKTMSVIFLLNNRLDYKVLMHFSGFLENFLSKNQNQRMQIADANLYKNASLFSEKNLTDVSLKYFLKEANLSLHMENLICINKITYLSDDALSLIIENNPQLEEFAFIFRTYTADRLLYSIRRLNICAD